VFFFSLIFCSRYTTLIPFLSYSAYTAPIFSCPNLIVPHKLRDPTILRLHPMHRTLHELSCYTLFFYFFCYFIIFRFTLSCPGLRFFSSLIGVSCRFFRIKFCIIHRYLFHTPPYLYSSPQPGTILPNPLPVHLLGILTTSWQCGCRSSKSTGTSSYLAFFFLFEVILESPSQYTRHLPHPPATQHWRSIHAVSSLLSHPPCSNPKITETKKTTL